MIRLFLIILYTICIPFFSFAKDSQNEITGMEEIFYQTLFWIAILAGIALAYKHDERLGKILFAPFLFGIYAVIILSIYSLAYYLIDANSFQLKHPELYEYVPKLSFKNLLLELLGIICIFYSSYLFFKNITKETYLSWISFIKFLVILLIGIILILKY